MGRTSGSRSTAQSEQGHVCLSDPRGGHLHDGHLWRPGPSGPEGLFVSFRTPEGTWTESRAINLGMQAGTPAVSPDGKYLFFTAGERGKSDIYWVDGKVFKALKPGGPQAF